MLSRWKTLACAGMIGALAMLHFVWSQTDPRLPFWDENYYVTSAQRYVEGIAQFSSHPPLGLMLLAAGDAFSQVNHGLDTSPISGVKHIRGEDLPPGFSLIGLRLLPSWFAAAGAIVFFMVLLLLTRSRVTALAFSGLYVYENAFIVHLSAAHLDAFQMFFSLLAVWCVVLSIRRGRPPDPALHFLFGLTVGLATLVKANALVLAVGGLWMILPRSARNEPSTFSVQGGTALRAGFMMLTGFFLAVMTVMTVHASISRHAPDPRTETAQKDGPYFSETHRQYLDRERSLSPSVVTAITLDYLRYMDADQRGIAKGTRDDAIPLLWPLHDRALNYRWDSDGQTTRYVQLAGNLVNWAAGLLALIILVTRVLAQGLLRLRVPMNAADRGISDMLLWTYIIYMAAHIGLGTQRVMYLYHYFIPLMLTFLMVPIAWRLIWMSRQGSRTMQITLPLLLLAGAMSMSHFLWPISRQEPLTHEACEMRNALVVLIECR